MNLFVYIPRVIDAIRRANGEQTQSPHADEASCCKGLRPHGRGSATPFIPPSSLIISVPDIPSSLTPQANTRFLLPLPCPLHLPHSLVPLVQPVSVPAPKPFEATKRDRRLKPTRSNPYKMEHLRLRSEVKWRLKDLGFEKGPAPSPVRFQ